MKTIADMKLKVKDTVSIGNDLAHLASEAKGYTRCGVVVVSSGFGRFTPSTRLCSWCEAHESKLREAKAHKRERLGLNTLGDLMRNPAYMVASEREAKSNEALHQCALDYAAHPELTVNVERLKMAALTFSLAKQGLLDTCVELGWR